MGIGSRPGGCSVASSAYVSSGTIRPQYVRSWLRTGMPSAVMWTSHSRVLTPTVEGVAERREGVLGREPGPSAMSLEVEAQD